MEQALLKLARQLDSLDEASLVALWDKYFERVSHFEPSRRWEESVLVLSLIQAKRMKNQLFNCEWAARSRPGDPGPRVFFNLEKGPDSPADRKPTAKILAFADAGNRPKNRQPENRQSENRQPENDPAGKEPLD